MFNSQHDKVATAMYGIINNFDAYYCLKTPRKQRYHSPQGLPEAVKVIREGLRRTHISLDFCSLPNGTEINLIKSMVEKCINFLNFSPNPD